MGNKGTSETMAPGEEKPRRELAGKGDPEQASAPRSWTVYSQRKKSGLNFYVRIAYEPRAGVAQWIERCPATQRVAGLIPSQDTCLGFRPGPH